MTRRTKLLWMFSQFQLPIPSGEKQPVYLKRPSNTLWLYRCGIVRGILGVLKIQIGLNLQKNNSNKETTKEGDLKAPMIPQISNSTSHSP